MQRTCAVSGQSFEITDEDLKFYEKMGVPIPTLCPEERQRRRIASEILKRSIPDRAMRRKR
jgi:hypothetical protein